MDSTLAAHAAFAEHERYLLSNSAELRAAAEQLKGQLSSGPARLLARTDGAFAVAAAASVLRSEQTIVERAFVGRTGWAAPAGAVLVETSAISQGLEATLRDTCPGVEILVLPDRRLTRLAA